MSTRTYGTDFTIVTAATAGYFSLLQGLLDSLAPLGKIPICVLDLGMLPSQLQDLHARGIETPAPGWDITVPSVVRSMISAPTRFPAPSKLITPSVPFGSG